MVVQNHCHGVVISILKKLQMLQFCIILKILRKAMLQFCVILKILRKAIILMHSQYTYVLTLQEPTFRMYKILFFLMSQCSKF
jgi:hypothetical protein